MSIPLLIISVELQQTGLLGPKIRISNTQTKINIYNGSFPQLMNHHGVNEVITMNSQTTEFLISLLFVRKNHRIKQTLIGHIRDKQVSLVFGELQSIVS